MALYQEILFPISKSDPCCFPVEGCNTALCEMRTCIQTQPVRTAEFTFRKLVHWLLVPPTSLGLFPTARILSADCPGLQRPGSQASAACGAGVRSRHCWLADRAHWQDHRSAIQLRIRRANSSLGTPNLETLHMQTACRQENRHAFGHFKALRDQRWYHMQPLLH